MIVKNLMMLMVLKILKKKEMKRKECVNYVIVFDKDFNVIDDIILIMCYVCLYFLLFMWRVICV